MSDVYLTFQDVVSSAKFPFTKGQLNFYITKRHKNGLSSAVRKIGRRIYFHEASLIKWIESHKEKDC
jgi:hypothetical protein